MDPPEQTVLFYSICGMSFLSSDGIYILVVVCASLKHFLSSLKHALFVRRGLLEDHLFLQPLFAIPFPAGPAERWTVTVGVGKHQWWSKFMALRSSLCHLQTMAKPIWLGWKAVHDNEDRRIHPPVILEWVECGEERFQCANVVAAPSEHLCWVWLVMAVGWNSQAPSSEAVEIICHHGCSCGYSRQVWMVWE